MVLLNSTKQFELVLCVERLKQFFRPVGDSTFSLPAEKVSKETGTESLSNTNNKCILNLPLRTCIHALASLIQTSCLALLK